MWDVPALKASYELELRLASGRDVVSVMPVFERVPVNDGSRERGEGIPARERVLFQATPPLTPYLFAFAIGEFDRVSAVSGSTPLSIVLPTGMAAGAAYALGATGETLGYLERYLDEPYPLPKLDAILLPGARGGAISNWGAIQYAERYLVVDAVRSSEEERFVTSALVAHELAHQWFGNLVTPAGPGDRWLSEGVAAWLEHGAIQALHPDWRPWLRAVQHREAAMRIDAGARSHAIAAAGSAGPASGPGPPVALMNEIVYDKSAQVLRMLESFAGAEVFRRTLQSFLDRHRHGVIDDSDLWAAFEATSLARVAEIGRDFISQAGVPLIEVLQTRCERDRSVVLLKQGRFGTDEESRAPREWRVPVTAMSLSAREPVTAVVRGQRPVEIAVPGCGAVKVNAGQIGYYRTRYDPQSFDALRASFGALQTEERLGMMHDEMALADAEYVPYSRYLQLAVPTSVVVH
jgi:aminopeptidase N